MLATSSFVSPYFSASFVAFMANPMVNLRSLFSISDIFPSPIGMFIESAPKPPIRSGSHENNEDFKYRAFLNVCFQMPKFENVIFLTLLTQVICMDPVILALHWGRRP